jgi:hypothetical protein
MNAKDGPTGTVRIGGRQKQAGEPTDANTHRSRRAWLALAAWVVTLALTALGLFLLALSYGTPVPPAWGFRGYPAILAVAYSTVGAIVTSRHPDNRVGWLFCATGLLSGVQVFVTEYATVALLALPGILPAGLAAAWIGSWIWVPLISLITTFLLLLFPTGQLPSPRWRPVAWLSIAWIALGSLQFALMPGRMWNFSFATNPVAIEGAADGLRLMGDIATLFAVISGILSASALIARFRRSRGDERQQLKWFAYSGALLILGLPSINSVAVPLAIATQAGIPIAAGIAILKYRLYNIDIIIRRTLIYGALTAALVLSYFGTVVLLEGLFRGLMGQGNAPAITVSTLTIAALFNPLRRGIQNAVDRRFYRRKYDAVRVLSNFGASLRDEVDRDRLAAALLQVVEETMQPAHMSLWLPIDKRR